jgi:hypothetical protein
MSRVCAAYETGMNRAIKESVHTRHKVIWNMI